MSNSVFPLLPGLTWDQVKTPIFSTRIQKSTSGREARAACYVYPLYYFGLSYELLRDTNASNELKQIMGFYLARQGAFDSFLYVDPSDYKVFNQAIGTGNGAGTNFQMVRTYGNFVEPIYDLALTGNFALPNGNEAVSINIKVANNNNTAYTWGNNALLCFNAAPSNGAAIIATFYYYYRVRFEEYGEDSDEAFVQFMRNLWELKKVDLYSVR